MSIKIEMKRKISNQKNSVKQYNIMKAASWYTVGNILVKSVSFLILPLFTALMTTTEYGIYSVYVSYLSIFETITLLGLSSTVRIAKFDKGTDFDKYMSTIISIPVIMTVLGGIFINVFLIFSKEFLSMNRVLWNCLLFTCIAGAVENIISARLVIDAKYKVYMIYSVLMVIVNVGVSVVLCYTVYANHDTYMARVVGQLTSYVVGMLFILGATKTGFSINRIEVKKGLIWGVPLLFHTLATVVLTQSDRIIIRHMNGYSEAGIYSIAVTLIAIPLTLYTSFESAWAPWFYDKLQKIDYEAIRKTNDIYIGVFTSIIVAFMLIAPELVHFFTNKNYWDSIYCLVPLCLSVFGEMLYSLPINIEYFHKKTQWIMWGTIIVTALNIILDIGFIYIWGFIGAAYATSISKMLLFLFHYILACRLDKNKIFHNWIVISAVVVLIVVNFFVILTVKYLILRGIVLGGLGIVLFILIVKKFEVIKSYIK